jgi:endopeptidase Clp ATP-binding regulatory subunit ClpX
MEKQMEKIPDPKEIEKDIGDFLSKKYGGVVKMISPMLKPEAQSEPADSGHQTKAAEVNFDLKPEELIAYLDQYIIKQDAAKEILATKVCTHFNRIRRQHAQRHHFPELMGSIKNNVLMIGPTGVGKTYMVKLIAEKLGVPFVKGDATKFSETGYVGGDVEDLVRDLVREADDDLELAQYGIIYIDEIDKIAGSRNTIGVDVSRAGVQRALLKPMEETEVDLKVPHDPISMFQELERYRKTGDRDKRSINTKHILFIMSGAFADLPEIIHKRVAKQGIGFGAAIRDEADPSLILAQVKTEDLIGYGFESEFVGRLPVRAIFERLEEADLYAILQNPNNPIVLGKKLDFAAYDIEIKFAAIALERLAAAAYDENTGARGLVSAVERALLPFERRLPSIQADRLPVTETLLDQPQSVMMQLESPDEQDKVKADFKRLAQEERYFIKQYLTDNKEQLSAKYNLTLTPSRSEVVAGYYGRHVMDIGQVMERVRQFYDEVKKIELHFFKQHDINIVLENDAVDFIIETITETEATLSDIRQGLDRDFELGLKLVQEKTGKNRFFISRDALLNPEDFIAGLIKSKMNVLSD